LLVSTRNEAPVQDIVELAPPIPLHMQRAFDWRRHATLSKVVHQGECGACWAIATASSLADRASVATKKFVPLSPAALLCEISQCDRGCVSACTISQGFLHAARRGVPVASEECGVDLSAVQPPRDGSKCRALAKRCARHKRLFAVAETHTARDIEEIKRGIGNYGPVATTYRVFDDFVLASRGRRPFERTKGIYVRAARGPGLYDVRSRRFRGFHAVVIVGWGREEAVPVVDELGRPTVRPVDYWIVRNSWGPRWGEHGYFKCAFATKAWNADVGMDLPLREGDRMECGVVFARASAAGYGAAACGACVYGTSQGVRGIFEDVARIIIRAWALIIAGIVAALAVLLAARARTR
jgi:hypothetical protein